MKASASPGVTPAFWGSSPVFESRSASAGRPLGSVRFAAMVRAARGPVYALGGLDAARARRLIGSGAIGIAGVEALAKS